MPEVEPDSPFPLTPLPRLRDPDLNQITLPLPNPFPPGDGGSHAGPPSGFREISGAAAYTAVRLGDTVLVRAQGQLASAAQIADLKIDSRLIHPFQLRFVIYTPVFVGIAVVRDFDFVEMFGFPKEAPIIVIHDARGSHEVAILDIGAGRPQAVFAPNTREKATGFGGSLQEAFDNAVKSLPASTDVADDLLTYRLIESGFLRGGFAGFSQHYAIVELDAAAVPPP